MSVWVMADLHLSFGTDKPMDNFFGWKDYVSKIEASWKEQIKPEDTVVIPGDFSWGLGFDEALPDFKLLSVSCRSCTNSASSLTPSLSNVKKSPFFKRIYFFRRSYLVKIARRYLASRFAQRAWEPYVPLRAQWSESVSANYNHRPGIPLQKSTLIFPVSQFFMKPLP